MPGLLKEKISLLYRVLAREGELSLEKAAFILGVHPNNARSYLKVMAEVYDDLEYRNGILRFRVDARLDEYFKEEKQRKNDREKEADTHIHTYTRRDKEVKNKE